MRCPKRVNLVALTLRRSLPVYPDKQTFSEPVGKSQRCQQRTCTSCRKGCELTLMAGNVATLHAAPLPTNVASMKSRVADSSIQLRWGGWRAAAGISVCGVS
jgi:hypothetical protein